MKVKNRQLLMNLTKVLTSDINLCNICYPGSGEPELNKDNFACNCQINDSINLRMNGTVRDVGFTNMIFERDILIGKHKDSINLNLGLSEFRGVLMKEFSPDIINPDDRLLVFCNKALPGIKVIDPKKLIVVRADSILNKIRNPYELPGEAKFYCGNPGRY